MSETVLQKTLPKCSDPPLPTCPRTNLHKNEASDESAQHERIRLIIRYYFKQIHALFD